MIKVKRWASTVLAAGLMLMAGCVTSDGGGGSGSSPAPANGSLGGVINLPERVMLDSDTRDPGNPSSSNSFPAQAQPVSNRVVIAGNATVTADADDYFAVVLTAGETVKLTVADYTASDLDLYLYQAGATVAASTGAGKAVESLQSPGAGDYLVRVRAVSGGANYRLQLGSVVWSPLAAAGVAAAGAEEEFVPGEVLVQMKAPVGVTTAEARGGMRSRAEDAAGRHGFEMKNFSPNGLARMTFDPGVSVADAPGRAEARRRTLDRVRKLRSDPEVAYAEPNFIVHPTAVPNDTYYVRQWHLRNINLPAAWDLTTGSAAVIVAVIDTGVLYNHPDLTANILRDGPKVVGYDMISDVATANDGDGPDPDPYDAGDEDTTTQSSYHGTHVAGTIGATGNNGTGVTGINWTVRIMPVRALGKGGGTNFDVAEGIKFAAGLDNAYHAFPKVGAVITPADIINLSLGGPSYSQAVQDAINMARSAGVTVVAAGGNDATSAPFYPAAGTGVIGVSAVNFAGSLAYYSNYGNYIDLAAPGGDVYKDLDLDSYPDGILSTLAVGLTTPTSFNYAYYQGTSMAAPHVAGVIALMKAYHNLFAAPGNKLTPEEIDNLIRGTAAGIDSITNFPLGYWENQLGFGVIDAEKATLAAGVLAGHTAGMFADLNLQPTELQFGLTTGTMKAGVTNSGIEALTNLNVTPYPETWLSHALSGHMLTVTVDRTGLAQGDYQAGITVNSDNGGSETLIVKLKVNSNLGRLYVGALNLKGQPALLESAVSPQYTFDFYPVRRGKYIIVAGTDLDNDGLIGDDGEFFGAYPDLASPQTLSIATNTHLSGLNFTVGPVSGAGTAIAR